MRIGFRAAVLTFQAVERDSIFGGLSVFGIASFSNELSKVPGPSKINGLHNKQMSKNEPMTS